MEPLDYFTTPTSPFYFPHRIYKWGILGLVLLGYALLGYVIYGDYEFYHFVTTNPDVHTYPPSHDLPIPVLVMASIASLMTIFVLWRNKWRLPVDKMDKVLLITPFELLIVLFLLDYFLF